MNLEIKKEAWAAFFDSMSKRRFEWMTEIEVLDPSAGDQTLSSGLTLNGITVEEDGPTTVVISVIGPDAKHQTHTISDPTRIAFLESTDNYRDVVDIEEASGTKTLIRFVKPMGLLVGIAEYEMTAFGG